MFAGSGVCEYIDESHMNEIIAVNGSSPAYIYLFAKAMADYAKNCGIDYDKAMNLVCATLEGSAAMLRDSGEPVETLIDRVCSKGAQQLPLWISLKNTASMRLFLTAWTLVQRGRGAWQIILP